MARVQQRTARKDYPEQGIKKGDKYYFAQIKTGPYSSRKIRSLKPIPRSALTTSDYLSQLYDWEDRKAACTDMSDAESFAQEIRELGEQQQEKYDNMPEGLQQGDTGQMIEARAQACEAAADEIDEIVNNYTSETEDEDDSEAVEEANEQYLQELHDVEVSE